MRWMRQEPIIQSEVKTEIEIQIKTTMKYHLMLVRMPVINKSTNNKCWRGCGKKGTLLQLVGMQTGTATVENSMEIPLKAGNKTAI